MWYVLHDLGSSCHSESPKHSHTDWSGFQTEQIHAPTSASIQEMSQCKCSTRCVHSLTATHSLESACPTIPQRERLTSLHNVGLSVVLPRPISRRSRPMSRDFFGLGLGWVVGRVNQVVLGRLRSTRFVIIYYICITMTIWAWICDLNPKKSLNRPKMVNSAQNW